MPIIPPEAPAWRPVSAAGSLLDRLRGPSAVLALAIGAAILCGLFLHPRAFVLAAGTTSALAVGVAWPWLAVRGLSGTLRFDRPRAREGEPVTARLLVRNRLPIAAWGLIVRDVRRGAPGLGGGMARSRGWRSTEVAWDFIPPCRGVYPGLVPRIATAFPFGLREASRPLAVPTQLVAWPATFPVCPIPGAAIGRDDQGQAPRDRAGTDGDPIGVRPYRRGDSLRRVHWPQSARHGELIVCELHAMATPRVRIVLDVHPDAHVGAAPDGTLEWAVRVAASFAEGWTALGAEVELVFGKERAQSGAGATAVRQARLLDALARLRIDAGMDLGAVLDAGSRIGPPVGLQIVVATDLAVRGMPPRLPRARPAERFVVLQAAAFASRVARADAGTMPITPWIWLDDPNGVPNLLRRGRKEVARG